jgi:hypothetical protein
MGRKKRNRKKNKIPKSRNWVSVAAHFRKAGTEDSRPNRQRTRGQSEQSHIRCELDHGD